jgi:hypothetical protein
VTVSQAWSEAQVKVAAVNNIVDALEAHVSTPETIVAELVRAGRCASVKLAVTRATGEGLPPAECRPSLSSSAPRGTPTAFFSLCLTAFLSPGACDGGPKEVRVCARHLRHPARAPDGGSSRSRGGGASAAEGGINWMELLRACKLPPLALSARRETPPLPS